MVVKISKNAEHVTYAQDMLVMYCNGRAPLQNSNQHSTKKKPQLAVLYMLHHFLKVRSISMAFSSYIFIFTTT